MKNIFLNHALQFYNVNKDKDINIPQMIVNIHKNSYFS